MLRQLKKMAVLPSFYGCRSAAEQPLIAFSAVDTKAMLERLSPSFNAQAKFFQQAFFDRHVYSTKTFIIPVICFSLLYNVSKFFELNVKEVRILILSNGTEIWEGYLDNQTIAENEPLNSTLQLHPTDLRLNPVYIRVYILWMNLIFNILGPFIVLATLNHTVSIIKLRFYRLFHFEGQTIAFYYSCLRSLDWHISPICWDAEMKLFSFRFIRKSKSLNHA